MEVGEEGERKGEVNRSEVKWNANAAEEEAKRASLSSCSSLKVRRERESSGGWRLLDRE